MNIQAKVFIYAFILLFGLRPSLSIPTEAQETIISKKDTDLIFSFTRPEWERDAKRFFARDWKVKSIRHENGNIIIGFHPSIQFGISMQALYENDSDPPVRVIVGNYFPMDVLPALTNEAKNQIQTAAQADLGPSYFVGLHHFREASFEVIELTLKRAK